MKNSLKEVFVKFRERAGDYVSARAVGLSLAASSALALVPFVSAEGEPTDVSAVTSVMTSAAGDMKSEILAIAPVALGVGVTILVITVAWRFFRKLAK